MHAAASVAATTTRQCSRITAHSHDACDLNRGASSDWHVVTATKRLDLVCLFQIFTTNMMTKVLFVLICKPQVVQAQSM